MIKKNLVVSAILGVLLSVCGVGYAITVDELQNLNWNNEFLLSFKWAKVDWDSKLLYALGRAPLSQNTSSPAQARLMARRAALMDARRNALLLLYAMKYGVPSGAVTITLSGKIVREHLLKGWVQDDYYYVRIAIPLKYILVYCVKIK